MKRIRPVSAPAAASAAAFLALAAIFGLVAEPVLAAEPTADPSRVDRLEIVDRAIAFHGGELYRASTTSLDVCSRSGCTRVTARLDGELFDYEVVGEAGGGERRVHWTKAEALGERLEVWQDGVPVSPAPEDARRLKDWAMSRVYFAFLPFRLNDPNVFKQDLGLEVWGERQLHKVKITFAPGSSTDADDEYLFWFDPQTAQVEQFAYSYAGKPGGLRFRRAHNGRRVGGILFYDQENLGAEGEGLRVDRIDPAYVETLRKVSDVTFDNITVRPLAEHP